MTISTGKDGVTLVLRGREQFWALRAKVFAPVKSIKDVRYEPMFHDWRKWQVRMPGTHAPKLLLAGSYWTEEGWDFLYIRRPIGFINPRVTNVLVIETDQSRYSRIIVSYDEKEADKILSWWKKTQKTKK